MFGVPVLLPEGWSEDSVYLFTAGSGRGKSDASAPLRANISISRALSQSLEGALEKLGPGALGNFEGEVSVLLDELRQEDGSTFFERIVRFADPEQGHPVQQGMRVYHAKDHAWILVLTAPSIEFNSHYPEMARMAAEMSGAIGRP